MNLHNSLSVIYETQILENGRVVERRQPKRNLILDSGLDRLETVADNSFWECFKRCVLGDGTKPTKRDSGAITVTISSEIATASAGYFEVADVGRLLKLDSGQEAYIDGFTSSTEVTVTGAIDDTASEATVWYVNETGHENELSRTGNLSGDSGDVSSNFDGTTVEHKRTFIFPEETEARTYREIGWSDSSSVENNLFGRDLIPGGGDSISPGQQYKVIVRLQIALLPLTQIPVDDVGSGGWDTSGDMILTFLGRSLDGASNDGIFFGGEATLEPHADLSVDKIGSDFTLPSSPSLSMGGSTSISAWDVEPYVSGSFEKVYKKEFGVNSGINGDFFGITIHGGRWLREFAKIKFDSVQTKDSDHKLTVKIKKSWGRTLTN